MSTDIEAAQVAEDQARTETDDDSILRRRFAAQITPGDGRTIDVRVVPYGERIVHDDGHGGVPKGVPYTEEWMRGAFADQAKAAEVGRAKHVFVNFEHQDGIQGIVGHGKMLLERDDGFYGTFTIHETPDGDKALMLIREGALPGVSMEARAKSVRGSDGVIKRVKGHLVNIALTRFAAYKGATVLAVREEAFIDEELLPVNPDPEVIERCRRLGIALPQRYQAHPAETGTPDNTGTPEDGTRQTDDNKPTLEV